MSMQVHKLRKLYHSGSVLLMGLCMCGAESLWEISVPTAQCWYEAKTSLKQILNAMQFK